MTQQAEPSSSSEVDDAPQPNKPKTPRPRKPGLGTVLRASAGAAGAKARPPSPAWVAAVRGCASDVLTSLYERYAAFALQDVGGLRDVMNFVDKLSRIEKLLGSGVYYSGQHVELCARSVLSWSEQMRARYPISQASSKIMIDRLARLRDAINSNHPAAVQQAAGQQTEHNAQVEP